MLPSAWDWRGLKPRGLYAHSKDTQDGDMVAVELEQVTSSRCCWRVNVMHEAPHMDCWGWHGSQTERHVEFTATWSLYMTL